MKLLSKVTPWVLVSYIVVMVGLSFAGAEWPTHFLDEYVHVDKLRNFLDYGLYSWVVREDPDGTIVNVSGHIYVYGPLFSLVAHAITVALGAETWGSVSVSDAAFVARHYAVTLFSTIAVVAAGWAVTLVTRSKTWGLVASAIVVSIPMWTASAIYNVKDIPAASGFTLFTAGCIAVTRPLTQQTRNSRIAAWLALFGGAFIIWGIRPGLWALFALAVAAIGLVAARLANFTGWATIVRSLIAPVTAIAAAYLAMVVIYPTVFSNPIRVLIKSFTDTSDFSARRPSLTNGVMPDTPPSWDFLPQWIGAQFPELIVAALIVSAGVAIWLVLRRLVRSEPHPLDFATTALVFVFIQVAAFPVAAILLHSKITSGIRQFLFIVPGTAMLVTIVAFLLVEHWAARFARVTRIGLATLFVASTALTTVLQFQLFPYQANYFNPSTFARGIEGRWELDRYGTSEAELYSLLTPSERERCVNCELDDYPSRFLEISNRTDTPVPFDRLIQVGNGPRAHAGCETVAQVTRPYLWSNLAVRTAVSCPVKGVDFAGTMSTVPKERDRFWNDVTQWGWASSDADSAVSIAGQPSALAWLAENPHGERTLRFRISLGVTDGSSSTVTVSATVNGEPMTTLDVAPGSPAEFDVEFPSSLLAKTNASLAILEFTLRDSAGEPVTNQLRVTSVAAMSPSPAHSE